MAFYYLSILLSNFNMCFVFVTEKLCATLPPITAHLIMNVTSMTFNSTLTLSCSEGYELVGSSTMVCGEGGEWTGPKPHCESKTLYSYRVYFLQCKMELFIKYQT